MKIMYNILMLKYIIIIFLVLAILWEGIKIQIGSFSFEIYPLKRFF